MQENYSPFIQENQKQIGQLLEPLFYYDIFSYPLTAEEILKASQLNKTPNRVEYVQKILAELVEQKYIFQIEKYYLLSCNKDWVIQRKANNQRAEEIAPTVQRMTKLMTWFPYVRGVFISGSLSKGVMPKDGDIDYFIVTQPQRLWIARTFLVVFKKIFLLNSKKYFCVNYFVSEDRLEIEEKNRFTATEIATVLPTYGQELYQQFWEQNNWILNYYPNISPKEKKTIRKTKKTIPQVIIEFFFNRKFGEWLDAFLMKRTLQHWNKKFGDMEQSDFELALKTRQSVSKHHPQLFQRKVIAAFKKGIHDFEQKHQIDLLLL